MLLITQLDCIYVSSDNM